MKTINYCLLFGALTAAFTAPVLAQSSDPIEEVLVTATKREQTLQSVPLAVSVVSEKTILQAQINDIMDLQGMVPSLRVTQLQTTGNTNFIIRGFGNGANNPGIEPSVGVFIDGVYRSRSASALSDLPDLERIEVLRGPQSTLFGKNASAGVINVVTSAPDMEAFGGNASITYGNYNELLVKGDITGPISEQVGFSLSAGSNTRDGYYENLVTGKELNERDRWGVRGQLLFLPTDDITLRFIADYDKLDERCCGVANLRAGPTAAAVALVGGQLVPNDAFAYENYYDFDPDNEIENWGVSLQGDFNFASDLLLTSITSYREQSRYDNADVDFTSAELVGLNSNNTDIETFTQELRLTQAIDNFEWLLGAFYFSESVSYDNALTYDSAFRPYADILSRGGVTQVERLLQAFGLLPPGQVFFAPGQGSSEFTGQDDDTISLFGQGDWNFAEKWTLTGGLNYTKVKKDAFVNAINTDVFSAVSMPAVGFAATFFQLTGLPPTPANIAANPQAAAIAGQISVTPCTPQTGPVCNPTLALQPLQFLPPFLDYPNSVENGKSNDHKTTWTAVLAYEVNDAINVYARAATGFKATSWNLSRDSRPFAYDIPPLLQAGLGVPNLRPGTRYAGPETATVYELGFKGNWDTADLYLAVFDQEIDGFQSNIFTGTGFVLANAGKQSTKGLEIESNWTPNESWQLTFAGTFLDPKYDSFVNGSGVNGPEDLSGTTPAGIHKITLDGSVTYYFPLGSVESFVRGEYTFADKIQVIENVPEDIASRKVSTFNASLGFAWTNGLELILWGRNIFDDEYLLSAFPSVAQAGSYSGYPNQPRTYGATLRVAF